MTNMEKLTMNKIINAWVKKSAIGFSALLLVMASAYAVSFESVLPAGLSGVEDIFVAGNDDDPCWVWTGSDWIFICHQEDMPEIET